MSTPTTPDPPFACLPVAVRAYATEPSDTDTLKTGRRAARPVRSLPQRTLIIDCETTADHTQRLLFGVWRLYVDRQDAEPGRMCVQEGIFHADELPDRDPEAMDTIRRYVRNHRSSAGKGFKSRLALLTRAQFVEQVLYRWGYLQQATIVGFNLPFDLTRLATYAAAARGRNRGGISLRLWNHNGGEHPFRPRVVVRTIDRYRTLISFTTPADADQSYRGKFLDLATLSFAHTDRRGLTLERACDQFGTGYTKRPVEHGQVTDDYLTYCREDVDATARLFQATHLEHHTHPIQLATPRTFSAASIGKAYWKTMGIPATSDRTPQLPDELAGWGMAAFFGGRAECRIRRVDVPVIYVDFLAMYMTCNALMGTWQLLTAADLTLQNTTRDIRTLLADPQLPQRCMNRDMWAQLPTLVQVRPNGATLPVRARYDTAAQGWGIGVNPLQAHQPLWYPLGDLIASTLLDDNTPEILQAFTLVGDGHLDGLCTTRLCGDIAFNPKHEDFFVATVEHRRRSQTNPALTPEGRQRLDRFLKVLANATGFGTLAEFRRTRQPKPVPVTVHAHTEPFTTTTLTPETPGPYCFPMLAATLTGAGRLMLALLEHHVTQAGGTFAFCDTDSMAIVATDKGGLVACAGGPHTTTAGEPAVRALSRNDVDTIVDHFTHLNPYDTNIINGSILEIEKENYRPDGHQRQLQCFAISAKRYQLTTANASRTSVKRSEHGLGHLLNPIGDSTSWIDQAWTHLRHPQRHGPAWFDLPAVSRVTVSSPEMLDWFSTVNHGLDYLDQIKPGNFLLIAYPDPLDPTGAQPIAPYNPDPRTWTTLPWTDRTTGEPAKLTTEPIDGTWRPGTVRVRTYRDILAAYLAHPEAKALAPDGQPVRPKTTGHLRRRPVEAIHPIRIIGKEANDLDEIATGLTTIEQATNTYLNPADDDWHQLVVPTLRTITDTATIATQTGLGRRTIQRALTGTTTPRPDARKQLTDLAVNYARTLQPTAKRTDSNQAILHRHLTTTAPPDHRSNERNT